MSDREQPRRFKILTPAEICAPIDPSEDRRAFDPAVSQFTDLDEFLRALVAERKAERERS